VITRDDEQSAVYKLTGPRFDIDGTHYEGNRIA
jgi:hypothetical protein